MARRTVVILLWLAAVALAAALDRPVAAWVHRHGLDVNWSAYRRAANYVLKLPGEYLVTLAVAAAVGFLNSQRWRAAALVALSGAVSGLNGLVKWVAGRHRPVENRIYFKHQPFDVYPFGGGWQGLFREKNLCFPSGHACLAFATAAALAIVLPRWRWLWYGVAALVAAERVLENAHYVSDVVAGAALGVLAAYVAAYVLQRLAARHETRRLAATAGADAGTDEPLPADS